MAWTETPDGRVTCEHGSFAKGRSCPTCDAEPAETALDNPGPRESLNLAAIASGLPTMAAAEAMLYVDRKSLEATAGHIERLANEAIADGDRKSGASLYSAAVRYRVEAGKHLRHAISMVTHRDRAASAERFDRLHMSGPGAGRRLAAGDDGSDN